MPTDTPFAFDIALAEASMTRYDRHIKRHLSAMSGQYLDHDAYQHLMKQEDTLLYEVFETTRPETAGELLNGLTIIHSGRVGQEYFMTKGHFHAVMEATEVYYCLKGQGRMVMENPEGDWAVEDFYPGRVVYIPARWAHRTVNTSSDTDLVFFWVCPANAGHDYGTIERHGFRKLVVEVAGQPQIIDNPRWRA
jgi:glucose-6-phosphate isomerase